MNLRKGLVVDTHPEDNSVDIVMLDDGSRLVGVQVLTQNGSARSGSLDLPDVTVGRVSMFGKWNLDLRNKSENEQHAIVGFMGNNPVVLGFLLPQINQLTFKDKKRSMSRHQSDVYHTIDGEGNVELHHPSGAYVRLGETPDHEALDEKNFDQNFRSNRNVEKKVHLKVKSNSVDMENNVTKTTGNLTPGTCATGTFTTGTGIVVTVKNGIITNIY